MRERKRNPLSSQRVAGVLTDDVMTRPRSIERVVETAVQGVLDDVLISKAYGQLIKTVESMPVDLKPTLWIFDTQRILRFNTMNYREPASNLFDYVSRTIGKQIILIADDRSDTCQPILMNATSLAMGRLKIHHVRSSDESERVITALRSDEH